LRCAKAAFTAVLEGRPNQLDKLREDVHVTAEQLLDVAATPGEVTEAGLRNNVSVGIQYLASWLHGTGAVAIFNLMEDTATAEISRSQVWQWLHNDIVLADTAQVVSRELVERIVDEEIAKLPGQPGDYAQARATFVDVAIADDFAEFLTLPAYERMPWRQEPVMLPWSCGRRRRGCGPPFGGRPGRPDWLRRR
jgi:malate synthase